MENLPARRVRLNDALRRLLNLLPSEPATQEDYNVVASYLRAMFMRHFRLKPDVVQDLINTSLERALASKDKLLDKKQPRAWIATIARRLAIDWIQENTSHPWIPYDECTEHIANEGMPPEVQPDRDFLQPTKPLSGPDYGERLIVLQDLLHAADRAGLSASLIDWLIEALDHDDGRGKIQFLLERKGIPLRQYKALCARLGRLSRPYIDLLDGDVDPDEVRKIAKGMRR